LHNESCYAESCYAESCYTELCYAESCYSESAANGDTPWQSASLPCNKQPVRGGG